MKIWRVIAGFVLAICACAQSSAQQTKAQLNAQNNAVIVTNGVGAITAANLHPIIQNMINAACTIADPINCPITALSGATTPGAPLIGAPSGGGVVQGTRSGNTTVFPTLDSTPTNGQCPQFDSFGGFLPIACPTGSAGGIPNASGSNQNTTAGCVSGNATVPVASVIDFAVGQGVSLEHCGAAFTGAQPTGLTVVANTGALGTQVPGTTPYSYMIACVDNSGGIGPSTAAVAIGNGDATPGRIIQSTRYIAYNTVSWSTTCPAVALWRNKNNTTFVLIGIYGGGRGSLAFDIGQPTLTIPWVPASPTVSLTLNDRLVTTISSINITTPSITVAAAPSTASGGAFTRHDDTAAIAAYLASGVVNAVLTPGTYNVEGIAIPSTVKSFKGTSTPATTVVDWQSSAASITASAMLPGFQISDLILTPLGNEAMIALLVANSSFCEINNIIASGGTVFFLSGNGGCKIDHDTFFNWYVGGINDTGGNAEDIHDNEVEPGVMNTTATGILVSGGVNSEVHHNVIQGGESTGIVFNNTNNSKMDNNVSLNSNQESYIIQGSASFDTIDSNIANEGTSSFDNCISVSDGGANNIAENFNTVSNNKVIGCGANGIDVTAFGGTGDTYFDNVVTGNTIYQANVEQAPSQIFYDIFISGVNFTYVNGNTCLSGASFVQYAIAETTMFGAPTNTQVGSNYGSAGSIGFIHVFGTGSVELTAATSTHSTGF